jgi:acyl-CoA dehydrogenase
MLPTPHQHAWMTEDIAMLREQARRFIRGEMAPQMEHWMKQGFSDPEIWRKAGALGLLLPEIPETYGGAGATLAHQFVVQDELAMAGVNTGTSPVHVITSHYILDCGTEAQKQRWLPRLASGEWLAAIAMTEPGAGSDLQGIRTRAVRDGDHYVISGAKTFITGAHNASLILVVCKTDSSQGAKGISLIAIERPQEQPGFRLARLLDKVGMKSSDTAELFFDDLRVPAENLLGEVEGQGFFQLMSQLPFERTLIAAGSVASIELAVELTLEYTKERKAFGKSVFDFQNTQFKLAECATVAHVMRCFLNDCIQRLVDGKLEPEAAYMAKWWCSEQQGKVLDECLQFFGGFGYMNEYPIARMWADARVQKI